jgi:hypothetical protein
VDPLYEMVGVYLLAMIREGVRRLDLFVDSIMGAIVGD